jgi:hypothetical protein
VSGPPCRPRLRSKDAALLSLPQQASALANARAPAPRAIDRLGNRPRPTMLAPDAVEVAVTPCVGIRHGAPGGLGGCSGRPPTCPALRQATARVGNRPHSRGGGSRPQQGSQPRSSQWGAQSSSEGSAHGWAGASPKSLQELRLARKPASDIRLQPPLRHEARQLSPRSAPFRRHSHRLDPLREGSRGPHLLRPQCCGAANGAWGGCRRERGEGGVLNMCRSGALPCSSRRLKCDPGAQLSLLRRHEHRPGRRRRRGCASPAKARVARRLARSEDPEQRVDLVEDAHASSPLLIPLATRTSTATHARSTRVGSDSFSTPPSTEELEAGPRAALVVMPVDDAPCVVEHDVVEAVEPTSRQTLRWSRCCCCCCYYNGITQRRARAGELIVVEPVHVGRVEGRPVEAIDSPRGRGIGWAQHVAIKGFRHKK